MTARRLLDSAQLIEFKRVVQRPVQGVEILEYDFGTLKLDGVDLAGAVIYDSVMDGVSARGASFSTGRLVATSLVSADLSGAQLIKSEVASCNATRCLFTSADLFWPHFAECELSRSELSSTRLDRTSFFQCDLRGATFTNAVLKWTSLTGSRLGGANFTDATGTVRDVAVDVGVDEPDLVSGAALLAWMREAGSGQVELAPDLSSRKRPI